ncbi:unnamed protein product, partial [Ixodes hexagonus]
MGTGQSAVHATTSTVSTRYPSATCLNLEPRSQSELLWPVQPRPVASPPPRPASRDVPSPPSPSKATRVPLVQATQVQDSHAQDTHGQRRHSVRADSPMPRTQPSQSMLRWDAPGDPVLDMDTGQSGHREDLDSQIREIEENTGGFLEDIEDECYESQAEEQTATTTTVSLLEVPAVNGRGAMTGSNLSPQSYKFEKKLFLDKEGFLPLGRPQLPPTRSTHTRRASVPKENALRNKHRKFLSRTTVPDARGPQQPGAATVMSRIREQAQRRLNTTHVPTMMHQSRRQETERWSPEQEFEGSFDFEKYRRANARVSQEEAATESRLLETRPRNIAMPHQRRSDSNGTGSKMHQST